ncbi:MAG TPA: MFS transporter [Acidimicrobiaceae bacterium]|nr:MFS transporter [Acidimicrobiaceae bacterium]
MTDQNEVNRSTGLYFGVALLMLGNGLQGSLLSVRAESEGFSETVSGLIMAMNYVGFLVGTRVAEKAVQRVGHIRVFAALASTGSTAALLAAVWIHPLPWGVLRFSWGLCLAGLLVVTESWLNEQATNANRGRMLALYMVVVTGSIAAGHLLVTVGDVDGFELFALASVLASMALVPVAMTRAGAPPLRVPTQLKLQQLLSIAPMGVVVSFLSGCATGTIGATAAVFAAASGFPIDRVALFVAVPLLGSVLLQIPIGRLSDVVPRRVVILGAAAMATALSLVMAALDAGSLPGLAVMFAVGSFAYPLYPLSIAVCNDWLEPEQRTGASSLLIRINGAGAIVGPVAAAVLMAVDLKFFFVVLAGSHAAIVAYALYRMLRVRGTEVPTVEEQGVFLPFPARASRMAAMLLRGRLPRRGGGRPRAA